MFSLHTIGMILAPGINERMNVQIPAYVDQVYHVETEEKTLSDGWPAVPQNICSAGKAYSKALRTAVTDGMNVVCIQGDAESLPAGSLEGMLNRVIWNRTKYIHLHRTPLSERDADIHPFIVSDGDSDPHFSAADLSGGLTVLTAQMAVRIAEILSIESKRTLVAIQGFEADISRILFLLKKYGDGVLIVFDEGCRIDEEIEERSGVVCIALDHGSSFAATATEYANTWHYDTLVLLSNGPSEGVPILHDLVDSLVREEVAPMVVR